MNNLELSDYREIAKKIRQIKKTINNDLIFMVQGRVPKNVYRKLLSLERDLIEFSSGIVGTIIEQYPDLRNSSLPHFYHLDDQSYEELEKFLDEYKKSLRNKKPLLKYKIRKLTESELKQIEEGAVCCERAFFCLNIKKPYLEDRCCVHAGYKDLCINCQKYNEHLFPINHTNRCANCGREITQYFECGDPNCYGCKSLLVCSQKCHQEFFISQEESL